MAAAAVSIRTPTHASSSRRRAATATLSMQQLRRASSSSSSSVALAAAPAAPVLQLPRQAAPSLASFTHGSTQRRGLATSPSSSSPDAGGGFSSEREYHAAADEALEEVQALLEGMEDAVEDFEVNYSVRGVGWRGVVGVGWGGPTIVGSGQRPRPGHAVTTTDTSDSCSSTSYTTTTARRAERGDGGARDVGHEQADAQPPGLVVLAHQVRTQTV